MKQYEFHEYALLFPRFSDEELHQLADDIIENGLKNPITLYRGKILDGRNRYLACEIADIEPHFTELTNDNPLDYVISMNLKRRHLNESQRAVVAEKLANMKVGRNWESNHPNLGNNQSLNLNLDPDNSLNLDDKNEYLNLDTINQTTNLQSPPEIKPISLQQAADLLNVSRASVANVRSIRQAAPEKIEEIMAGAKTIHEVQKEIRQVEKNEQKTFEAKSMPEGMFNLIYCDPPWRYDFSETDNRKIENQYPTMSLSEICQMELPQVAENCLLLMWATAPKLIEALDVIKAWGFTYKTHCVWDKVKIGMGYWFRGQHELLLVATKGDFSPPEPSQRISSIHSEERMAHSQKPTYYYEWIEKTFPLTHKIELFSRIKRSGWEVWGNE